MIIQKRGQPKTVLNFFHLRLWHHGVSGSHLLVAASLSVSPGVPFIVLILYLNSALRQTETRERERGEVKCFQ